MTIALHPYALGLPLLTWAGLFGIVGALVGGWLFLRAAPEFGTGIRGAYGIVLASVLAGFVGARVLHMADYVDFYSKAPFHGVYLWNGGLSLWGGVLGGLLGGLALARQRGLEVARVADAAAVPALIGLAVGRLGDFLAGSRAAEASSLPWAVAYTNESDCGVRRWRCRAPRGYVRAATGCADCSGSVALAAYGTPWNASACGADRVGCRTIRHCVRASRSGAPWHAAGSVDRLIHRRWRWPLGVAFA